MDACREALIGNGIWLAQYPVPVEAVIQAGYKTGESYERLYVSPINKSI